MSKKSKEDLAFEEADGIANNAFVEICQVFEKFGLKDSFAQSDWARTVMEKWA